MKQKIIAYILQYLRFFARIRLQKMHPIIIGVAGSSGKSSLVKLLATVLTTKYRIKQTGGKNSEVGIPLHILDLSIANNSWKDWLRILLLASFNAFFIKDMFDLYLVEMGIDSPVEPKNMSYLLKIVQPAVGVVTNVGFEHSVYFDPFVQKGTPEEKQASLLRMTAEQETLLLTSLPVNGTAVVNIDNAYIRDAMKAIRAKMITISVENTHADLHITEIKQSLNNFSAIIVWKEKSYELSLPFLLPTFYLYEFLFALAVGLVFDISIKESITAIEKHFELPPGRCTTFKGIKDTILIDSSYNNATREPILGMLDMLKHVGGTHRRVAILGDMRELGSQSKAIHEEVARKMLTTVNTTILIGPLMREYVAPILKARKSSFQSFQTFTEARDAILSTIHPKDIILIKGSQNTLFLERVVEMLLADKQQVIKLCRRGVFWDAKRASTL
ncbi:MAG TPA: Mur ligase family protein [Patescibacteria group bacterium]|nr:Mur ligase family protein [Patescibacteria group bacterium]